MPKYQYVVLLEVEADNVKQARKKAAMAIEGLSGYTDELTENGVTRLSLELDCEHDTDGQRVFYFPSED